MQASIELLAVDGGTVLQVTAGDEVLTRRPVRRVRGAVAELLAEAGTGIPDETAAALADAVERSTASTAQLAEYGRLLFDAAFGPALWARLVATAETDSHLELAIAAPADGRIQALYWEALHDGTSFVAARGVARAGREALPVAVVRLVRSAEPPLAPVAAITQVPKVLFAVGSRLTDPRVRPGAEFMGILRQLEQEGGAVQARTLESASLPKLVGALKRFTPDVLHLVGHGRYFRADGEVKLQLEPDGSAAPGDEWVTAASLAGAFQQSGHTPTAVVLSACQTATATAGGATADPEADGEPLNSLPFAGQLVALGVPVAVAMAGDVADTACRVFTRALTSAVESGVPLVQAVIAGRAAAFWQRPDPDSIDWIRPVLFLREDLFVVPPVRLVDDTAIRAVRERVTKLDLAWAPVFFGRQDFLDAFDRLLDPDDGLNALVAAAESAERSYGGMRLLRELGARAVRAGWLPLLLGPFDRDPPTDLPGLADTIATKLRAIRRNFGLPLRAPHVKELGRPDPAEELAFALRDDLAELARDMAAADPQPAAEPPRTVLLCHRVDQVADAVYDLLELIGPAGFGAGDPPLPVVLTGAAGRERGSPLKEVEEGIHGGALYVKYLPLRRFRCDGAEPEDVLAYQWWLLNPPSGRLVYALRRGSPPDWQAVMRMVMEDRPVYDKKIFDLAGALKGSFVADDDNAVLSAYSKVRR